MEQDGGTVLKDDDTVTMMVFENMPIFHIDISILVDS